MDWRLRTVEKRGKLDDLLLGAIDETMRRIFREAGSKAIYDYLENNSHLKREKAAGLERLLGSAAPVIGKWILKNLHSKLELKFKKKKSYEFSDYVKELRKR